MTALDDLTSTDFHDLAVPPGVKISLIKEQVTLLCVEPLRVRSCDGCAASFDGPMPHLDCVEGMPDCTDRIYIHDTPEALARYVASRLDPTNP